MGTDERWHDYGGIRVKPMAFRGHSLLCRKCRSADEVGGVLMPDSRKDRNLCVEVLAVGGEVGKPLNMKHSGQRKMASSLNRRPFATDGFRVGQILLCPNEHEGIRETAIGRNEYVIEESVPLAILA